MDSLARPVMEVESDDESKSSISEIRKERTNSLDRLGFGLGDAFGGEDLVELENDAEGASVAEEDEDSESDESQISSESEDRCHLIVRKMLEDLCNGKKPIDKSEETTEDGMLNSYRNLAGLRQAGERLKVKTKDKSLDVFLRARVEGFKCPPGHTDCCCR